MNKRDIKGEAHLKAIAPTILAFVEDGLKDGQIADRLNEQKILTERGAIWNHQSVRLALVKLKGMIAVGKIVPYVRKNIMPDEFLTALKTVIDRPVTVKDQSVITFEGAVPAPSEAVSDPVSFTINQILFLKEAQDEGMTAEDIIQAFLDIYGMIVTKTQIQDYI